MIEKKYEFTGEQIDWLGHRLHQIRAIKDFGTIKKGDIGGWIEKEENLSHDYYCWVYGNARVYGYASVCENASVYGNACVYENAKVCNNAHVYGNACVYENAKVCNNAHVYGNASVYGDTMVYGDACVYENAMVFGNAMVLGNAKVCGNASVYENADVYNNAHVYGNTRVCGNAKVYENAHVYGDARVFGNAKVCGNARIMSDNDYATISNFGSQNRTTTFQMCKDDIVRVKCGCFWGTINEFRNKVKETHKDSYLAQEYLMISDLMEFRFNNRQNKGRCE